MKHSMRRAAVLLAGAGLLFWAGCGKESDHAAPPAPPPTMEKSAPPAAPEPASKAYPLKICVVSGEELGKMGEPKRIVYEGQEIKFCCPNCEKDFRKEPAKYLKKIEDARKGS